MTARFAEYLKRENPLELIGPELKAFETNKRRPALCDAMKCQQDIFIGVFFDGTGNNKYRDTGKFTHSNVARLYEAYVGAAFPDTPSLGKDGGKLKPDLAPAWPKGMLAFEKPYYRKFYTPGLGTPFPELGDNNALEQALGGGVAFYGDERLDWALLQLANHVHAALMGGKPLTPVLGEQALINDMDAYDEYRMPRRHRVIADRSALLAEKIAARLKQKPAIRSVRLSVFGFSRGAALARAFCNRVIQTYGGQIGGIKLEIDFLGIFDTVASVGAPNNLIGDGQNAWASKGNLAVSGVRRCVHLVAAHEVRGAFPLTASGSSGFMKEVVYPGAHSDVGGGYAPGEQGRSNGGDARKLSQIPLAQMYREALIGGVPLLPAENMDSQRKADFNIDPQTIAAFNAYIQATRSGEGKPDKAMWLTETQPPLPLKTIMRAQWGVYLRWRKLMQGKQHQLPGLRQSGSSVYKQAQEIEDIRANDAAIAEELQAIRDESDDYIKSDKYKDWLDGVRAEWENPRAVTATEKVFFETLVHDSRAGFSTNIRDDAALDSGKVPSYHRTAIRQKEQYVAYLKKQRDAATYPIARQQREAELAREEQALANLKSDKSIIVDKGGYESADGNGYLRWRAIL